MRGEMMMYLLTLSSISSLISMFFVSVRRDYSLHIRFPYNPFDLFGIKDGKIFNRVAANVATEDEIPRLQCENAMLFYFHS